MTKMRGMQKRVEMTWRDRLSWSTRLNLAAAAYMTSRRTKMNGTTKGL